MKLFGTVTLAGFALICSPTCGQTAGRLLSWGYNWYVNGGPNQFRPVTAPPPDLTNAVSVTGGAGHGLALRPDGTVRAWGDNSYRQAIVPGGLSNVVGIAAGYWHNLTVSRDGFVTGWGAGTVVTNDINGFQVGQSIVPRDLTNAVSVAAGFLHSVALRADGTVIAWGMNSVGQTNVPAGLSNVVAIACGDSHSLALKADGTVVAWGHYYFRPASVPAGLSNIVAVAAGGQSLALKSDGTVVAWGEDNQFGQLDPPPGLSNVVEIEAGGVHNLALTADGVTVAWGAGKTVNRNTGADWGQSIVPTTLTNAATLGAGYIHSVASAGDFPPFFTGLAAERTVLYGTGTWFRMSAAGSRPFQYQWKFNGDDLPGATNAVLEMSDVRFENAGVYSLAISNSFGSATSPGLKLNVAPLFLTVQPRSQVTVRGRTVKFEVAATGPGPVTYQWLFNGAELNGETNSSLVLVNVRDGNAGTYAALARSPLGTLRSGDATLDLTQVAAWGNNSHGQTNVPPLANVAMIAAGGGHAVALNRDGSLAAWGDNTSGQSTVPADLAGVTAVAAGAGHNLAVRTDRTVAAWGNNYGGQTDVPPDLRDVVAVAAGSFHSLALRADGSVVIWGSYYSVFPFGYFPITPPTDWNNMVAIAAGDEYSLGLKADGTVVAWSVTNVPMRLPAQLANVVALSANDSLNLALKADGTVLAWRIGATNLLPVPPGLTNVTAIAAGEDHGLALKADGSVIGWKAGDTGGFPPRPPLPRPVGDYGQAVVPPDLGAVTAIAAGRDFSVALMGEGSPLITAPLASTALADGTTAFLRIGAVGAGPLHYQWRFNGIEIVGGTNAVLKLDPVRFGDAGRYSVVVWNSSGSATNSDTAVSVVPFFISRHPRSQSTYRGATVSLDVTPSGSGPFSYQWQLNGVDLPGANNRALLLPNVSVEQSGTYSVKVTSPAGSVNSAGAKVAVGRVIAWGDNSFGQTNLPPDLTNVAAVAAGDYHNVALKADGTVVAWGMNKVASTTTGQTNVPSGLDHVVAIAAGGRHCLALQRDGAVVFWGDTSNDQIPRPSKLTGAVAVAAGSLHSLVLRSNGTVVAWGYNAYGEARVPPGLTNVLAIAAGGNHNLALKSDGTVRAWGDNGWGQARVPAGLSNVVSIAAGFQHSVALKADGTVAVWGAGYAGATNIPPDLDYVVAIAAGGHHTLTLKADGTLQTWGDSSLGSLAVPRVASNVVSIAAGAAHNLVVVDTQVPLLSADSISIEVVEFHFRQTGLIEQLVRVFNRSALPFGAVRLLVGGLGPEASVYNAFGTNARGEPYIQFNQPLAAGASVNLTIEYFVPDRSIPEVTLTGEVVAAAAQINPVGVVQEVARSLRLADGSYLIDFRTLLNRTYYIQYSSDLANWNTARPPVTGTGTGVQWLDNGPPKTDSAPGSQPARFYRVLLTP